MADNPMLAEALRTAKTRPMYFGFVAKDAQGELLLKKSKVSPKEVSEAKKRQGGGQMFRGMCLWEDGQLVFEVGRSPPAMLAAQIKKAIKRDAQMSLAVITRFSKGLEADEEQTEAEDGTAPAAAPAAEPEQPARAEEQPKPDEKAPQPAPDDQELRARYAELSDQTKAILSGPNGKQVKEKFGAPLMNLLQSCQQSINAKDVAHARGELDKLDSLLAKMPSGGPTEREGKELVANLNELAQPIKELLQGRHKDRVLQLLRGFDQSVKNNDYGAAGMALSELEGYIKQPPSGGLSTEEWKDNIEIDDYKLGKQLGQAGGTGYARLLQSTEPGAPPLVGKFLNDETLADRGLLETEAEIYDKIGDHPNIPKCFGMAPIDGKQALVLECVEGETARDTLREMKGRFQRGELSQEQYWGAIQYMTRTLLQTLAHIEDQGLVHSDVKPQNMMIDKDGELKLIDLGGAVGIGQKVQQSTPVYAGPEGQAGEDVTGAFDVFSSGQVADDAMLKRGREKQGTAYQDFLQWLTDPDPAQRPTAKQALAHPFLADALLDDEGARAVLSGEIKQQGTKLPVTAGFTQAAWDQTMAEAVRLKKAQAGSGPLIAAVSDLLRQLQQPAAQFKNFPRQTAWPAKSQALDLTLKALDALKPNLEKLRGVADSDVSLYISKISDAVDEVRKEVVAMQKVGPPDRTTIQFAEKWRSIKAAADADLKTAVSWIQQNFLAYAVEEFARVGLDKFKSAEKYFDFSGNFSGALADMEEAASRRDESFAAKKAKAQTIAQEYFRSVETRWRAIKNVGRGLDLGFLQRLLVRLNDLVHSISEMKI